MPELRIFPKLTATQWDALSGLTIDKTGNHLAGSVSSIIRSHIYKAFGGNKCVDCAGKETEEIVKKHFEISISEDEMSAIKCECKNQGIGFTALITRKIILPMLDGGI